MQHVQQCKRLCQWHKATGSTDGADKNNPTEATYTTDSIVELLNKATCAKKLTKGKYGWGSHTWNQIDMWNMRN